MARRANDHVAMYTRWDTRETLVATDVATGTRVVDPDPHRVVIVFSTAASPVTLSTQPNGALASGVFIPGAANPVVFSHSEHGYLAQCAWHIAVAGPPGSLMTVLEVFLDP